MIRRFNYWYRHKILTHDGRAVWWEHVYFWAMPVVLLGFALAKWVFHSPTAAYGSLLLSVLLGTYSWWQDVQLCKELDMEPAPQTWENLIYAPVFLVVTLYAMFVCGWI